MKRLSDWAVGHPIDLAVFRIVVCSVVLLSADVWSAHRWSTSAVGLALTSVVLVASALTLVGLFTRPSSLVAAISTLLLLGIPQRSGQVMHTHHLVWFLALIAASPSGDALSLDARRRRARLAPSLAHGLPLRLAWLSVGLLFFFAGLWKAVDARAWLEALPALVEWKWFQLGGTPALSLSPELLRVAGAGAIGFELGFCFLLFSARTRVVAAVLAVLFHLGIQLVMGIGFSSLWACYVMFVPWAKWLRAPSDGAATRPSAAWPSFIVGAVLLTGQLVTGVFDREDTWPIAAYPSFRHPPPRVVEWLEVEEVDGAGAHLTLRRLEGPAEQRRWGLMTHLLRDRRPAELRAFYEHWRGSIPRGVTELRFFVVRQRLGDGSAPARTPLSSQAVVAE